MRRIAIIAAAVALVGLLGLYGCVTSRLPNVALQAEGPPASPAVLDAFEGDPEVTTPAEWTERRAPLLRAAFAANVYGAWPQTLPVTVANRTALDPAQFAGTGVFEQVRVRLGQGGPNREFSMLLAMPAGAEGPLPVIVLQNFCGNAAAFPDLAGIDTPPGAPSECGSGWAAPLVTAIFGDAIITPPIELIWQAGYAVALFYPGEIVPDSAAAAEPALAGLTPAETPPTERTGAIAAWAWSYLRALEALAQDPRFDADRIVLWGHSRNGKAALLAAAMDPRPAAVIALQPGTAGGSLQRNGVGESIAAIMENYPHWFAPAYLNVAGREADLPVDQHQLLALIAPRPVLLAGARRDQWSDPHGAVRAAEGASPVYELLGAPGFSQPNLREMNLAAPLVTYMRPGLHGVHTSDWELAIQFLQARLPPGANSPPRP